MRAADAEARGLSHGATVRVATAHGVVEAELQVSDDVAPGVVVIPEGLSWAVPVPALLGGRPSVPVTVSAAER
jgi:anaerobic selenocysteine-containing dehydrogenase